MSRGVFVTALNTWSATFASCSRGRSTCPRPVRSSTVDGREIEFSGGFTDLHTRSYREILAGRGFGAGESLQAITAVAGIREARAVGLVGDYHPALREALRRHG